MSISVVIPIYNERDNLLILYRQLTDVFKSMDRSYEIVFVNDGSNDENIETVLVGDGHVVTVATDDYNAITDSNPTLLGDLSSFDAVFWAASGTSDGGCAPLHLPGGDGVVR